MLLRHIAAALALAATLGPGPGAEPISPATPAVAPVGIPAILTPAAPPAVTDDVGGGSPGLTCLGCVAGGVMTLASGSLFGVHATLMAGGATAVGYGTIAVTCTTACITYFSE